MAGPSRKEGLRCKKPIKKGRLVGEECPNLLLEEHPEFGLGIRCDNKDCGEFHTLLDLLGELRKQGKLEAVLAKLEPTKEKRRNEMEKVRVVENRKDVFAKKYGAFKSQIASIIEEYGWHFGYGDRWIVVRWPRQGNYSDSVVGAYVELEAEKNLVILIFNAGDMLTSERPQARRIFDQFVEAAHKISDKTGYEVEVQAPDYILEAKSKN